MPQITLYSYFRSSCSARLRIALALKNLPYTAIPVNLLKDEQHSAENTARNPSHTVPTLIIEPSPSSSSSTPAVKITQSLAALEYLDEAFPDTPSLLPPTTNTEARAVVRTLVNVIACDVQPVTNLGILKRVAPFGVDRAAWSKELIENGFRAYETIVQKSAGTFSVGDAVTMADVCLIPAVWGAQRVGVELAGFPIIERIAKSLEELDAVKVGHWRTQEDTPEDLRANLVDVHFWK